MSLNAKNAAGGGGFKQEPMDAGTYPGGLVQVIDLGVQDQRPFKGKDKDPAQEIYTTYEIADEFCLDEDGKEQKDKPRWVSERFVLHNLASERANSTKRYMAIDPKVEKDGDWTALLAKPVNIILTATEGKGKNAGKVYNNIAGLSSMRPKEADKYPGLVNPTKVFTLDDPDMDVFMALPEFLRDIIKKNNDFDGSLLENRIQNYKAPEGDDEAASKEDVPDDSGDKEDDGEW